MLTALTGVLRAAREEREALQRPCEHCNDAEAEFGGEYCRRCRKLMEAATNGSRKAERQLRGLSEAASQ